MENGPFEDVFPCISYQKKIKNELSIAMLVYRRVFPPYETPGESNLIHQVTLL